MDLSIAFWVLIFSYGFNFSFHLMGMTKNFVLKKFNWKKAWLGFTNELGFTLFWFLVYILPNFIDPIELGLDFDLNAIITGVLFMPLTQEIKRAYEKACELQSLRFDDDEEENEIINEDIIKEEIINE